MSVVAWKAGVMASDSKAYGGSYESSPGTKHKTDRLPDGSLLGIISSVVGLPERFRRWVAAGSDPAAWLGDAPVMRALHVKPDGEVFLYDDSIYPSGPIECAAYAIGSGGAYAVGAMAFGAPAKQAVYIALDIDPHCGGPVHTLTLES